MLIVAIDTSGRHGSVALCRGDRASFEILGLQEIEGGTYSARLIPTISELLRHAALNKDQVEAFVVVDGPGSFTGLRVGLSTVKALCDALEVPLAVVSMLEALAVTYAQTGEVVTVVLDAGRGEIYVAEYAVTRQGADLLRQAVVKLEEFQSKIGVLQSRVITTHPNLLSATLVDPVRADAIAMIGLRKLLAGDVVDSATIDANYIRRSDAELFSSPK